VIEQGTHQRGQIELLKIGIFILRNITSGGSEKFKNHESISRSSSGS
jgi:hypothetical protein